MAKFMIVGLDDPYNKTPLQPDIIGSSGAKLYRMSGLSMVQYSRVFELRNLFKPDDTRSSLVAKLRASKILGSVDNRYAATYIVCLGRVVADAFNLTFTEPLTFVPIRDKVWAAHLPHPSGLNRWYNNADNERAANEFMQSVAGAASGEIKEDNIVGTLLG